MKRKALGRGLSAILSEPRTVSATLDPEAPATSADDRLRDVPIEDIRPNSQQPRLRFHDAALDELAASIRVNGILQPLVARLSEDAPDRFELIAGERRLRAAKIAGLERVPVVVTEAEDLQALQMALVENLQRADLDPIEEARAFDGLMQEFGLTQEEVAERVGRSRVAVANAVRLLQLSDKVAEMVAAGLLSAGHGRALLSVTDPAAQLNLAERIVEGGLNVRQTERYLQVRRKAKQPSRGKTKGGERDRNIHVADLEKRLQQSLKTRVTIDRKASGKGTIELEFFDDDHLATLVRRLDAGSSAL